MLFINGLAAVVAKVAAAGTVAQATAGLGIALAGVTGAGAAGVLPVTVQDTVAAAVETVTPFDLPDSHDVDEADDSGVDGITADVEADDADPGSDSEGTSPNLSSSHDDGEATSSDMPAEGGGEAIDHDGPNQHADDRAFEATQQAAALRTAHDAAKDAAKAAKDAAKEAAKAIRQAQKEADKAAERPQPTGDHEGDGGDEAQKDADDTDSGSSTEDDGQDGDGQEDHAGPHQGSHGHDGDSNDDGGDEGGDD